MNRRAEFQRQITIRQNEEVDKLITQLKDAIDVADLCEREIVVIGRPTATRAVRNLEDLQKRFLMEMIN